MEKGGDTGGQAANNSSDFVRKLYKMLEDPAYEHIVRWGEGGESFVVLENEKFTKLILPKHFKHSNFASFVRQLNKYDFHKVRQNNEDNTPSPYGANAWEFRHPEFQANKKDSLDNIRRKAPAPRKAASTAEDPYPSQQIDLLNSQLVATQQQVQQLSDRLSDLSSGHVILLQQVVQLQKFVKNHEGVMQRVMGFLHSVDAQRRNSRMGFSPSIGNADLPSDRNMNDHVASPLQQATELLKQYSADSLPNKELEQMTNDFHLRHDFSTPPHDQGSAAMGTHTVRDSSSTDIGYSLGNDLESMVYPVGATNGIDPVNSEHIHNIPYALPSNGMLSQDAMPEMLGEGKATTGEKKVVISWGPIKPRILLVEDDKVCARIGAKFLQLFGCGVEVASNGLEAVDMVNAGNFDLILMDIIMPHLDGVSATVCIRESRPHVPIIAMTSNIRADDIDMYFRYGMNDVLPKPFTKEGMLRALEKNLPQFLKKDSNYAPAQSQISHSGGFATTMDAHSTVGLNMGPLPTNKSLKEEPSDHKSSSATGSAWGLSNKVSAPSPVANGPPAYIQQPMVDNRPYNITPNHPHGPSGFPPPQNTPMTGQRVTQRRVISELSGAVSEGPPDKRQRIFGSSQGSFPQ